MLFKPMNCGMFIPLSIKLLSVSCLLPISQNYPSAKYDSKVNVFIQVDKRLSFYYTILNFLAFPNLNQFNAYVCKGFSMFLLDFSETLTSFHESVGPGIIVIFSPEIQSCQQFNIMCTKNIVPVYILQS